MTDHYRDRSNFRSHDDDRNDDPAQRWRRGEERYRRETSDNRFDSNRFDDDRRYRESIQGRSFRDEDYGARSYGRENRTYGQRESYAGRDYGSEHDSHGNGGQPIHWHERDREQRAGHPYTGTYGGTGDSSYFTGSQGSWAVGAPRTPSPYYGGGQHFGSDYRSHGYARRDDDDDRRGFWDRASDEVASWFGDEDAARRREQDHRGHGPKDYKRSDERIREDANDKLTEDWRVDASNVTVTVAAGEITLDGTVASREAKRRAEDVVDRISGVRHVQNNLRVETVGSGATYSGNWAAGSTAEGSTLGRSPVAATKTTKV